MFAFRLLKALIKLSAAFFVSANTTPFPCVPSKSLTIKGAPPTMSINSSVSKGELAKPVVGIGNPLLMSICNENSLSLDFVIEDAVFKV